MAISRPEKCVCTALRQASGRVSQHYDTALGPVGISVNQYAILRRIDEGGPLTIHALAARLVMDRSTLGHLLRPLQARGLTRLGASSQDRRRREAALTHEGAALLARARPLWQAAQDRFERAYGTQEADLLRAALRLAADVRLEPAGAAKAIAACV